MKMNRALLVPIVLVSGCAAWPQTTVRSYYDALGRGDHAGAKAAFSENPGDGDKLNAVLTAQTKAIQECGGISTVELKSVPITRSAKDGLVVIRFNGNCDTEVDVVHLERIGREWRLTKVPENITGRRSF